MLVNLNFSKTALAVSLICSTLALTGCGSGSKTTAQVTPPVVPADTGSNTDGGGQTVSQFDAVQGHWNKLGYGEFIHINAGNIELYEFNDFGCIKTESLTYAQTDPLVEQLYKADQNTLSVQLKGDVNQEFYQLADSLPEACNSPLEVSANTNPLSTFDYFWHSFNDYYAFFDQRQVNWQQVYQDYRSQVTDQTTDEQLFEIFAAMVAPLADAHVSIAGTGGRFFNVGKPIPVKKAIEGGVVSSYRDDELVTAEQYEEVFNIIYLQAQKGYVTAQSQRQFPSGSEFPTLFWGKSDDNVGLLVINNMFDFVTGNVDPDTDAVVAAVKSKMDTVMAQLGDTDGMILDIRSNGGGTDAVSLAIAGYFADQDITAFSKQAQNKAGVGHRYTATVSANETAYNKPVYLLTSQGTASAAEIFTMAMAQLDHVTLVGESTSGALSDVLAFSLPNGWQFSLSNEVYEDNLGQVYEVTGFTPDYPAPAYSLESLISRKFESYELALQKLGKWQQPQLSTQQFETHLAELMRQGVIPGAAIAVVKSGEIVYEQGFGKADDSDRLVTSQTPFFLGSVSKTLLGSTIAQAEADNLLSLDDPIEPLLDCQLSYLPSNSQNEPPTNPQNEPPNNSANADFSPSFRHLVTHTAGIIDDEISYNCAYYLIADNSSLLNLFDPDQPCEDNIDISMTNFLASYLDQDGERYQAANFATHYGFAAPQVSFYSNISSALAGHALEQKVGKTLSELSDQYVFAPVGMDNTSWSIDGIPADIASRYIIDDSSGEAVPLPEYNAITYPDGAAISTAGDLAKYMAAAMNQGQYQGEQVLAASAVEQMLTSQTDAPVMERGIGYFWRLDGDIFSHGGADPGVMTKIWADRKNDVAIVLLTNGDMFNANTEDRFDEILALLKTFARSQ
ncbi:MAG: CubicO group peptidase (beta-lactamase class C family) [Phenylobacterium sp.]|jgi:CubicO group peptidase (beta-lactamase class C family)